MLRQSFACPRTARRRRRAAFSLTELPAVRRRGFSLIELLVVIAIIALLVTIISPSMNLAKDITYKMRCRAHLHAIMNGYVCYGTETGWTPGRWATVDWEYLGRTSGPWGYKATLPTTSGVLHRFGYVESEEIWLCPNVEATCPADYPDPRYQDATDPYTYHYTINAAILMESYGGVPTQDSHRRFLAFPEPGRTAVMVEENTGLCPPGMTSEVINDPYLTRPDITEPRHQGTSQVGFLDGHADAVEPYLEIWDMPEYCPRP